MSRSAGTGRPLTLRCARCKGVDNGLGYDLVATGRVAALTSSQRGSGGGRVVQQRFEYRCRGCGHVGWSRHTQAERLYCQLVAEPTLRERIVWLSGAQSVKPVYRYGPVYKELWAHRYESFRSCMTRWVLLNNKTIVNRNMLSWKARLLVNGAYHSLTGMLIPCNEYYFPDAMSEAIECAEELGL